MLEPDSIVEAYKRIRDHLVETPILQSDRLNETLKSKISFKFEGVQKVGAFKARGALNTLLKLKEKGELPSEIVAYSSGNHAQAVAWSAKKLGIKCAVFIPQGSSEVKIAATRGYGAEVVLTKNRQEAESLVKERNVLIIPPYDHDDVIAGQGTSAYEAWKKEGAYDAVFTPVGGGGLVSGTWLATQLFSKTAKVFGAEPVLANDASISYRTGTIHQFSETPKTIADGVRTLAISERTFQFIRQLSGIYEISEQDIIYWTQWITHLLKINVEPTSALGLAAAHQWIEQGNHHKKILVILSGANVDTSTHAKIWEKDYLTQYPKLMMQG